MYLCTGAHTRIPYKSVTLVVTPRCLPVKEPAVASLVCKRAVSLVVFMQ